MKIATYIVFVVSIPLMGSRSHADIIINGDVSAGTGQLVITADIEYTKTNGSQVASIVLDGWAPFTGVAAGSKLLPSLNLVTDGSPSMSNGTIYHGVAQNDVSSDDGWLTIASKEATSTFVLKSGVYSMDQNSDWNPALQNGYTFTGNTFLADISLIRNSNVVSAAAIPEPSSLFVFAMATGFLLSRRHRNLCNA